MAFFTGDCWVGAVAMGRGQPMSARCVTTGKDADGAEIQRRIVHRFRRVEVCERVGWHLAERISERTHVGSSGC
jgi:hypothetical protein